MKKTLSLFLSLVMLLSIGGTGTSVFALNTVYSVYLCNAESISLDIGPMNGDNPCFNFRENDGKAEVYSDFNERSFTNGVKWQDVNTYQILKPTDTFQANHTYKLQILLKCADGFVFNTKEGTFDVQAHLRQTTESGTSVYFYVDADTSDFDADTLMVSKTFTCPGIENIAEAKISMTAPQEGENPFYESTPANNKFYIDTTEAGNFLDNKVRWYNMTEGWSLNGESTFEAGNIYQAYVRLRPNNGYQFTDDTVVKFGTQTATIESAASGFIAAYVNYTVFDIVENVEMTIDVDFSASKIPEFFANSEEPQRYSYYDYNEDYFIQGVCYKDVTNGEYMELSGLPFFQGHEYAVTVAVKCHEAHKFTGVNLVTASINGVEAVASTISPFGKRVDGVWFFTANLGTCTKDLNECSISYPSRANYTYNGRAQHLKVNIYDNGYTLEEGKDYEVLYMGNRTNAGKVNFEILGIGNYSGSTSGSFKINAKLMSSSAKINISAKSYVYDSKVKQPTVTVYDGNKKLTKGTNYTVSYSNSKSKNVGEYSIKVTFKGNYTGSKSVTYSIVPKSTTLLKTASTGKNWISPQWKKQTTQTTGYEIMYSKSGGFKSGNKTATVSKNTQTVKKITGLSKNTKYYFKVRTYKTVKVSGRNKKIYSSWSGVKEFKTRK